VVERNKVAGIKSAEYSIMLYTLSTCVWCKKVKRLLGDLGLPYEYIDVNTLTGQDKNEVIEQVKVFNPMCSFPTMVVNGEKCIVGFKEEKIKEALQ